MRALDDIQAVSFDVGGTLIEVRPSVGHIYAEVAAQHGLPGIPPESLNQGFALAWNAKTNFDYSVTAWFELVKQTFGSVGPRLSEEFFADLYYRFTQPDAWRVHEDVVPALRNLAGQGLQLAAISNWDDRLRPLLVRLKLADYFQVIVISGEIGFQKPSPVIFEQTVRRLGLPAESVLHVGDSSLEDVQGARAAGLRAILLDRRVAAKDGERIRSLLDLSS